MKNVSLIKFKDITDNRGSLIALENNKNIPFNIKRVYYIYNTNNERRGFHAHKELEQVLVCVSGSVKILVDDGSSKENIILSKPDQGLYIGVAVWHEMFDFSDNCVLLTVASDFYKEDDYIRNYNEFLNFIACQK